MASKRDEGAGKWRIRWRNKVDEAGRPYPEGAKDDEMPFYGSEEDAETLKLRVSKAVRETGRFDKNAERAAAEHAAPANLIDGLLGYLAAQRADGVIGESTFGGAKLRALRIAETVGEVCEIPEDAGIPVTVLGRPLFDRLKERWNRAGATVAATNCGLLYRSWGWMSDDAANWPHVPLCPRSSAGYVPPKRVYGRTVAPTLAHVDAMLRHLRVRVVEKPRGGHGKLDTMIAALFYRHTGLRAAQVLAIHPEDLDVRQRLLTVRSGKSKQEKADMRTIPLSRHLLADPLVQRWLEGIPEEGPIFGVSPSVAKTIRASWQDATDAAEVPEHVWNPPQRAYSRPDHAIRSAFIGHMKREKVDRDTWRWLVGHTGDMADVHYGIDLLDTAREAVDALPAVDWSGPAVVTGGNVVQLDAAR